MEGTPTMRFIQEYGYTVPVGQEEAHQRWFIEHDAALRAAAPPGSRYLGSFAVVFSSEKQAGSYRLLVEIDSYGAMDASAAAMKDSASEWGRLLRDASQFIDMNVAAPWSNGLLKNVLDAAIWDPKQD